MSERYVRVARTREQAHAVITQGYSVARALLADGKRVKIVVSEDDDITIRQRNFLHGAVFPQISHQVVVNGQRYTQDIWKEFFRKEFLGDRWEVYAMPGAKRATPHRVRNSSEDLGVRKYSEYIDRVIAHAATEWGVVFDLDPIEREAVRWKPARARQEEAVPC